MGKVILVTGGGRSGKSSFSLKLASDLSSGVKNFIATAVITDEEMQSRIDKHRSERDHLWKTIESPYELAQTIDTLDSESVSVIDCCSVWLGNIWYKYGDSDEILSFHIDKLCSFVSDFKNKKSGSLVFVTNEVGCGIIPGDPATRRYRDWAGRLNQKLGDIASEVYLCVCGVPVNIKKEA